MTVEQLRQLQQVASRAVSCDHLLDFHDMCDECNPVEDAKFMLIYEAYRSLDALLDVAEAAREVAPPAEFLASIPGPYQYVSVEDLVALRAALARLEDR